MVSSCRFFSLWLTLSFRLFFCLFGLLFLLQFLFFLCLLPLLFLYFQLHSLQLIKAVLDLEDNLISFFLFMLQFISQGLVLFVGLSHALLIFVCDGDDFFDRDCISGARGWLLVDSDDAGDFLFESDWLKFVLVHDLSSIDANFIEVIDGLLGDFFVFLCLGLGLMSLYDLRLFLINVLWLSFFHLWYLNLKCNEVIILWVL